MSIWLHNNKGNTNKGNTMKKSNNVENKFFIEVHSVRKIHTGYLVELNPTSEEIGFSLKIDAESYLDQYKKALDLLGLSLEYLGLEGKIYTKKEQIQYEKEYLD